MSLLSQSLLSQPRSLPFFQTKYRAPLIQPLGHTDRTKGRYLSIRFASSSKGSNSISDLVELPIYQTPLVLFPGALLPLQICQFKYQIMMQTLLVTDRRFGLLFSNPLPSARERFSLQVGCVAELVMHQRLADGRFLVMCKGLERFRIAQIQRTNPYMVSTVTWLEDQPLDPAHMNDLEKLASEVEGYMNDVIRLAKRVEGKNHDNQNDGFDFRKGQLLTPYSFLVASCYEMKPKEQQELLEMVDTAARLKRERDMLKATINYLTAVLAVKDVFPSSR